MKRFIFKLFVPLMLLVPFAASPLYAQNVIDPGCERYSADDPNAPELCKINQETRNDDRSDNQIYGEDSLVAGVLRIFGIVAGVGAVIMIMIGGLKYITAGGDTARVSSAKNTILYAIIGLVIAVLAQVIIVFVINTV